MPKAEAEPKKSSTDVEPTGSWDLVAEQREFVAERCGRFLRVRLLLPHSVLSTSACNGGLRRDLNVLINHQSCEGKAHQERYDWIRSLGREGYHAYVCAQAGVEPHRAAVLGTAANMRYASVKQVGDRESRVTAIVTAGVQNNATAAGDPARWREQDDRWEKIPSTAGTINTILLINRPLRDSALVQAAMVLTEAKSSALWQLGVGSLYSREVATGTGTDQFCIAAADDGRPPSSSASTHVQLGQWIGVAVREAILEALRWQNGLEPSLTRSVFHALRRYGLQEEAFFDEARSLLTAEQLELLRNNPHAVFFEPTAAAAAYALAAVLDRSRYGVLPPACVGEALRDQGACLAAAIAAQPARWPELRAQLPEPDPERPAAFVAAAICLGWAQKWKPS
ncbi:MAG: adenosylcobinamide amidohydrolase [Bryobacterales bacterium]|nr:adenosylcobinamide amidohydrolase [Bryobacteraceae bacterium]MDW8355210.1 adenosylcobinamide amidohydrolase [Bryobacterales bacterium]